MANKKQQKNNNTSKNKAAEDNGKPSIAGKVVIICFLVFSLLVCLSLISYDPADGTFLSGGIPKEHHIIENWIGYVGASISRGLLLMIGFAAYPLAALFFLSCARRLFSRRGLRTVGWEYWCSFILIMLGFSMLFGIWPQFGSEFAASLNIKSTPGGVIGNKLCAKGGWMRIVMNPTGSAIVSSALIVIGLTVLWIYDWHNLFCAALQKKKDKKENNKTEETKEEDEPGALASATARIQQKLSQRREEREKIKQDIQKSEANKTANKKSTASKQEKNKKKQEESSTAPSPAPAKSAATAKTAASSKTTPTYKLPPVKLLNETTEETTVDNDEIKNKKAVLQETLNSFGIEASVGKTTSGPRVTLFEVEPAPGVKVERISRISNNIAMELRATSLRILTPIPGKKSVGIEVPNEKSAMVHLRNLINSHAWKKGKEDIPLLLGRNINGEDVILDLAQAPHLLIAGATGSGKSVCINALILSLLFRFTPDELRLILVDPKVVEFKCYNTLPHLAVPVITEPSKVQAALNWTIKEMERRYKILAQVGARNINAFNDRNLEKSPTHDEEGNEIPERLPYIVVIIDELADIMAAAKKEVENSLARIAQLSRAVGIHTVIATQRPSVNVITGIIKANFPTRIAFQVTSQVDSRTIMDGKGAESLLGKGDMLYKPPGGSKVERNQGALVGDNEIENIVDFISQQREPEYDMNILKASEESSSGGDLGGGESSELSEEDERLISEATQIILRDRRPTTSYVQRCLRIGYNRAAMLMEILEERGVVGPQVGSAPREILINRDETPENMPDDDNADYDVDGNGDEYMSGN